MHQGGMCKCPHHKVLGIALILIGLAFLLQDFGVLAASVVAIIWPILVIIVGAVKLGGCKCCSRP